MNDFNNIDELLLFVRSNSLPYMSAVYRDRRLVLVGFSDDSDSYIFDEYTGDRIR